MGVLLLILGGYGLWAWKSGKLRGFTYEDGIAAALFLLGLRFLTTGKMLTGAMLMAGAMLWAAHRRRAAVPTSMPVEDARRLLGVSDGASLAEIREAHRRLISRVHPDRGGSAELANRVNVARDILIAETGRRAPRTS